MESRSDSPVMKKPLYYDLDGFRLSAVFSLERFRSAVQYKPQSDDVFIVTYPKCGTTWLQEICYLIYNDGAPPKSALQRLIDAPFLEMLGAECISQMKKPGAIKSHLPFDRMPYSADAKYIHATRNPKDCLVSFYYHTAQVYPGYNFTDGTFEEFFELFINGQTDFGDYFEHVVSWLEQSDKANIHYMHFEDVKSRPAEEVLKLARFLGEEYEENLKNGLLDKILERSSLKVMRDGLEELDVDLNDTSVSAGLRGFLACNSEAARKTGEKGSWNLKSHLRKGVVNNWKAHFSPEMNRQVEDKIKTIIEPMFPELVDKWRSYGVFDPLPETH